MHGWMRGWTGAACALAAASALAATPMIERGTMEASLDGAVDSDGDSTQLNLNARGGYFVAHGAEAGVALGTGLGGQEYRRFALALFGEYDLDTGTPVLPFAGCSLGFAWFNFDDRSDSYVEATAYGGMKFFFVNYAALSLSLHLSVASEEVYNQGKDSGDWAIRIGTSWYF
jgi:hypothetical protein